MDDEPPAPKFLAVRAFERTLPSDDHLLWIGRLVVSWAHLEEDLHVLLQRLLGCDEDAGQIITARLFAHRAVRETIDQVAPVVLREAPKTADEIQALMASIATLSEQRNRFAHASWWLSPGLDPSPKQRRRGKPGSKRHPPVSVDELRETHAGIEDALAKVNDLILRTY